MRVFSSERAGSGKTLAVHRLNQNLRQLPNNDVVIPQFEDRDTDEQLCIAIPIYGPSVNQCSVVEAFLPHMVAPDLPLSRIFHLDVHPSVGSTQYLHVLSSIITKLPPPPPFPEIDFHRFKITSSDRLLLHSFKRTAYLCPRIYLYLSQGWVVSHCFTFHSLYCNSCTANRILKRLFYKKFHFVEHSSFY